MNVRNRDQTMDEKHRRRTGAFFTPKKWVDEAHKMLDEQLGPNWREEYVVWDASAGTANLTRDYKFKELYLSTLEKTDVDIILKSGFNPGAVVFQFDFLNDPIEDSIIGGPSKLPVGLRKALEEGRPIVFLNNPPYGTSSDWRNTKNTGNKSIVIKTITSDMMKQDNMCGASSDLLAQFVYNIFQVVIKYNLNKFVIGTFSRQMLFTVPKFKNLRLKYINMCKFKDSFLFSSGYFDGVSDGWGVIFTLFDSFKQNNQKTKIITRVKTDSGEYLKELLNNDDNESEYEWIELKNVKDRQKTEYISLSNPITIFKDKTIFMPNDSLGFYYISNRMDNSSIMSTGQGSIFTERFCITPENFEKCISSFSARVNTKSSWINSSDLYQVPKIDHPQYQQWVIDSIIVSLFSVWSYQSSLRSVSYHSSLWDLENHFFYLSNSEMRSLANQHNNTTLYQDTFKYPDDRFVYNKLQSLQGQFSPDAQSVLDKAIELTRLSFPFRKDADPKFHLNSWDAGWYQIRMGILKEHFPVEYEEFRQLLLALRKRMAPLVYELGFLVPTTIYKK